MANPIPVPTNPTQARYHYLRYSLPQSITRYQPPKILTLDSLPLISRTHSLSLVKLNLANPQASGISGGKIASDAQGGGIGRSVGGFIDPKLNWSDISWLRQHTKLPIGLKGVQSVEDAKRAMELGVDAIYLSNHGCVLSYFFFLHVLLSYPAPCTFLLFQLDLLFGDQSVIHLRMIVRYLDVS